MAAVFGQPFVLMRTFYSIFRRLREDSGLRDPLMDRLVYNRLCILIDPPFIDKTLQVLSHLLV